MSRFKKLSHNLWHSQYHIVWTPKYRLRILEGEVGQEVSSCVRAFSEQKNCEVNELNVQKDHVHDPSKSAFPHDPSLAENIQQETPKEGEDLAAKKGRHNTAHGSEKAFRCSKRFGF